MLPTGFGKSLCYACLPGLFDLILEPDEPAIVVVVTPLTAIMEDQLALYTAVLHWVIYRTLDKG